MSNCLIYGIPVACLLFLFIFGAILIPWQACSATDRGGETKDHSDRIYTDYDQYLKIMLALVAAFGYVRLEHFTDQEQLAREALILIGSIGLLVMVTFCIFIICHLGSKVRRWQNIEWPKAIFWQELWACLSMWLFASALWVTSIRW